MAWTAKVEVVLDFYDVLDVVENNSVTPNPQRFASTADYLAVHPNPIAGATNAQNNALFSSYQDRCEAWDETHNKIKTALMILRGALDAMANSMYVQSYPDHKINPYLLYKFIKEDMFRDKAGHVLRKKQLFSHLKIKSDETPEQFALRLRGDAFELNSIDPTNMISNGSMVTQWVAGICDSSHLRKFYLGSSATILASPNVEEAAKMLTDIILLSKEDLVPKARVIVQSVSSSMKSGSDPSSTSRMRCWHCGEYGHHASIHGDDVDYPFKPKSHGSSSSYSRNKSKKNEKKGKGKKDLQHLRRMERLRKLIVVIMEV